MKQVWIYINTIVRIIFNHELEIFKRKGSTPKWQNHTCIVNENNL